MVSALHFEIAFLQGPLPVIVDESQVASFQCHRYGLGFARIEGNLFEVAQADVVGGAACHEVFRVEQYAFLARHASGVGHVYGEGQFVIGGELRLVHLQVAILIGGVAQSEAEGPLDVHHRIVIVVSAHLPDVLARLVVVSGEGIDVLRIGVGHLRAEVGISGKEVRQGISSVIARKHDVYYGFGERLDVFDEARASFVQNQDNGFTGLSQCLYQVLLVRGEVQVGQVSRSLAIRVFPDAGDDDIGVSCGFYRFFYLRRVLFPPVIVLIRSVSHARLVNDVFLAELVTKGFVNGVVCLGTFIGTVSLPAIRPASVQAPHGVGVGSC